MSSHLSARETILGDIRRAVAAYALSPLEPLPAKAQFAPRKEGSPEEEMERMLREVRRLNGQAQRIGGRDEFAAAMTGLVRNEAVRTAAFSDHPLLEPYGVAEILKDLGVRLLPPGPDGRRLAECDLGMTVADAAIPETGTVLLRTTKGQADHLSILPRIHLALVCPAAFLPDLHQAFALAKGDRHFVLVSGSSRTADIEKVLTLGVHGPKSFHVWICD